MEKEFEMDCRQARQLDMVDYLEGLGLSPSKISGNDFWYRSPFREERTPSFKINRSKNRWYDWGEGRGGNLIDFAISYHNCTVADFLRSLKDQRLMPRPEPQPLMLIEQEDAAIHILRARPLWSYPLLNYLKERNIPVDIARKYCCEVNYTTRGKEYYGIGFKNDLGGFEIRNPKVKSSSSPKTFTTIKNGATALCIFEGFFDFLSFQAQLQTSPNNFDYLILNSLSFFNRALPVMEQYDSRLLYLDHNGPGRKCTEQALALSDKYRDESGLYAGFDDLNDYHSLKHGKKPAPQDEVNPPQKSRKLSKGL